MNIEELKAELENALIEQERFNERYDKEGTDDDWEQWTDSQDIEECGKALGREAAFRSVLAFINGTSNSIETLELDYP